MTQNPTRFDDVIGFKIYKLIWSMIFDWSNYSFDRLKFLDLNFELQSFAAILSSKIANIYKT